ncbi:WAS/WASL-interacting protein family member 3-like [Vulpes lagopus]|uniref:WAS/WASL-interacting protein family member 3-like n=1 Tax=Vulpes lagopus TaxID=494514 RepID=UPI001BCA06EC|nr:WAS/WASL-interacting protein family member 3-like [Vulpes lagopus]
MTQGKSLHVVPYQLHLYNYKTLISSATYVLLFQSRTQLTRKTSPAVTGCSGRRGLGGRRQKPEGPCGLAASAELRRRSLTCSLAPPSSPTSGRQGELRPRPRRGPPLPVRGAEEPDQVSAQDKSPPQAAVTPDVPAPPACCMLCFLPARFLRSCRPVLRSPPPTSGRGPGRASPQPPALSPATLLRKEMMLSGLDSQRFKTSVEAITMDGAGIARELESEVELAQ